MMKKNIFIIGDALFEMMGPVSRVCSVCRRERERLDKCAAICGLMVVAWVLLMLCGCAATVQKPSVLEAAHAVGAADRKSDQGWWAVRFKINRPEGAEPSWYMDPLLAHGVVSPVLRRYRGEIVVWRFHRRAGRDQASHQFSFLFYCSPATARKIHADIKSDKLLQQLKRDGAIIKDSYDDTERVTRPHIEDTSDPSWSPNVQKSWPYFIMGVSQTWLDLIELTVADAAGDYHPSSTDDLKALYRKVNGSINQLWRKEGGHAFLHHLNAIFGYTPVEIYEKRQMTF